MSRIWQDVPKKATRLISIGLFAFVATKGVFHDLKDAIYSIKRYNFHNVSAIQVTSHLEIAANASNKGSMKVPKRQHRVEGRSTSNLNRFNTTIVIQLSGEMGNNIAFMAHGFGLQWFLEEDHKMHSDIWLRHQEYKKWKRAKVSLQKCFEFSRLMDFEKGNKKEFKRKQKMQESWYGLYGYNGIQSHNDKIVSRSLSRFINDTIAPRPKSNATVLSGTKTTISLPFLYTHYMVHVNNQAYIQRHYHRYRDFFRFDMKKHSCCNPDTIPDKDESIFHFRNFKSELPEFMHESFPELGPNQVAKEIFAHLNPGDKVAIVSRFVDEYVQLHVKALEARGLVVRVITGNSGEQDFCFLLSAEKEIIGNDHSTFFFWAAVLGRSKKVRIHSIGAYQDDDNNSLENYAYPMELRERFHFSKHIINDTLDPDWRK